ncbi:MAG TPA: hypothetical protein VGM29_15845 [Polyangiaceae bacterium]|jgi:hypothetical protein
MLAGCALSACAGESTGSGQTSAPPSGRPNPDGTFDYSCSITVQSGGTSGVLCIDFSGLASNQITVAQQSCQQGAAAVPAPDTARLTFLDSACPVENILLGCKIAASDITLVEWFYSDEGLSASQVASLCSSLNGTTVSPQLGPPDGGG